MKPAKRSSVKGNQKSGKSQKVSQDASQRSYGLSGAEVQQLKAEAKKEKRFANPYRGNYGAIVQSLHSLGANKWHEFPKFRSAVASAMGKESWSDFLNRTPRNKETGKSVDERLLQNVSVLQRTKDYGLKLSQVGACIDRQKDAKGQWSIRLNTHSQKPQVIYQD